MLHDYRENLPHQSVHCVDVVTQQTVIHDHQFWLVDDNAHARREYQQMLCCSLDVVKQTVFGAANVNSAPKNPA